MSKFKVGDKLLCINSGRNGTVVGITNLYNEPIYWFEEFGHGVYESSLELINNKINSMEKFITMFLSEPEKSFRKAGITNGDGLITENGTKMFLTWLLKKNGTDFKTEVVDTLLEELKNK